jgi:hypothetical protein
MYNNNANVQTYITHWKLNHKMRPKGEPKHVTRMLLPFHYMDIF